MGGDVSVGYVFDISQTGFALREMGYLAFNGLSYTRQYVCLSQEGMIQAVTINLFTNVYLPLAGGDVSPMELHTSHHTKSAHH